MSGEGFQPGADLPSGAKSSQTEQNKAQIDFQFLNFSHPSDAKASRARKTVRSHVTRQQHQREQAAAAARRARSYHDSSIQHEPPPAQRPHSATFPAAERPPSLASSSARAVPSPDSPESSSASPASSHAETTLERTDTNDLYPEQWRPYIPRIVESYTNIMLSDHPDLDGTGERGLMRTKFLPFAFTDRASTYAVLLMAASHYSNLYGVRSHDLDLLQLRGMAIRAINDALGDRSRATSDQVVIAVAEMACYEALYGDRSIFSTHMTGLLRLVSVRGGVSALGLDGLMERFLLWVDSNTAHLTNGPVRFDPAVFPSQVPHPRPDPQRFAGNLPTR